MNTEQQQYQPGQEIEWVMRPLANGSYLKGIVVKLGARKIGIAVQSQTTGEWRPKWVHPLRIREVVV